MIGTLAIGSKVGHFQVEAEVGQGGMGMVYRAVDLVLNRPVALKILAPHLGRDERALARCHREAASVAKLRHPSIAGVYEFGEHEGRPYLAMEWVEGRTLKAVVDEDGPLPLERTLKIFDQLAGALDYAHRQGVIHRDIKPANILLREGDQAVIVDFGLARLAEAPALTTTGSVFGTPRYMSPEQILGNPVDGRADLYSLAIVVYEMLSGQPPFQALSTPAIIHKQLYATPPPITEINPSVPAEVEAVITKALAKDPNDRFPTLAAWGEALRVGLPAETPKLSKDELDIGARPPQASTQPAPAKTRRGWGWLVLAGGLCLGLLIMTNLLLSLGRELTAAPLTATAGAQETETAAAPTPEATFPLPETPIPTDTLPPDVTPTPITPVPFSPPVEGQHWLSRSGDAARTGFVYNGLGPLNFSNHWQRNPQSTAGTGLVVGSGRVVFGVDSGVRALDWAGGRLLGGWGWEVNLGVALSGQPVLYLHEEFARVFVSTANGELYALNLADGSQAWYKSPDEMQGGVYGGLTVGDDGTVYAVTDWGRLLAYEPRDGNAYWESGTYIVSNPVYLPPAVAGSLVFIAGGDRVYGIDLSTGGQWALETLGNITTPPSVAGNLGLVYVGTDQGRVHAFVWDGSGEAWSAQASSAITGLANDNNRLYVTATNGHIYAWEGAAGGEPAWTVNTAVDVSVAPLLDWAYVLVGTSAGDVRYFDVTSGAEAEHLRLTLGDPIADTPAPAGGWLFVRGTTNIYGVGP